MPVTLQEALLSPFIGEEAAQIWRALLVERSYTAVNAQYGLKRSELFYSAGQPMGALTS
jgi:hypothetical protein